MFDELPPPNPFCLSTTSYEPKQRNSDRTGNEEIVIFGEQEKNHYYFDTRRHKKGYKVLFLVSNRGLVRLIIQYRSFHLSRPFPVSSSFVFVCLLSSARNGIQVKNFIHPEKKKYKQSKQRDLQKFLIMYI